MSLELNEIFPCVLCTKDVKNDAIQCDICGFWVHRKCAKMNKKQLLLKGNPLYYYYCKNCFKEFPFMEVNNDELNYICFKEEIDETVFSVLAIQR